MCSPFDNIDGAFEPFYTDDVIIETTGGKRQTLACVVFDSALDEAITDESMDTDRAFLDFVFPRRDWDFAKLLRRGDSVTWREMKLKVQSVDDDSAMGVIVHARGV